MLAALLAGFQALAALPAILNDIKAAIASLQGAIAASQNAKFQQALADFQQKTAQAKTGDDYKNAALALHDMLNQL